MSTNRGLPQIRPIPDVSRMWTQHQQEMALLRAEIADREAEIVVLRRLVGHENEALLRSFPTNKAAKRAKKTTNNVITLPKREKNAS